MLSVPCVRGVTKLLSLHQLCCAGRLDSTVKSPHRKQKVLSPSLSLDDGFKRLAVALLANVCMSHKETLQNYINIYCNYHFYVCEEDETKNEGLF